MSNGEDRIGEALRAVGDDYLRRNPPDLLRARTRIEQLRRRRQMRMGAGTALATAAAVAAAVLVWPAADTDRPAPRPAGRIEAPSGSVSIPVGNGPAEIAVGEGALWVANVDDHTVSRIDPATNEAGPPIQLTSAPGDMAIGDSGEVWVASPGLGAVHRIDPVTSTTTPDRRVDVAPAGTPLDLAIDGYLWVSVVERELVQVDPATGDEVRRIDWVKPVNVAARYGSVFVLDAAGRVYGLDPATGEATGVELSFEVEGRGDVHYYDGSVWVAQGDGSTLYSADVASGATEIDSYSFRGTYVEMVQTDEGIVVLSDLGDLTGVLTLIDPVTGDTAEIGEIEGEPHDMVRGLDELWVSTFDPDVVTRIPSLP